MFVSWPVVAIGEGGKRTFGLGHLEPRLSSLWRGVRDTLL